MNQDKTKKRKMTAAELKLIANTKAAAGKKIGEDVVISSIAVIAADGARRELAIDDAALPAVKPDADIELVESDDGLMLQKMPPKHLRDAMHRAVGELLVDLQHRHDQGELKCLAVVWSDAEGTCFPGVAGMLFGEALPAALKELADDVLDQADGDSEDEGIDLQ